MTESAISAEKRKRPRVKLNNRLVCFKVYDYMGRLKLEDLPVVIGLKDISYGGIGGASKTKLSVGDQVTVNLVIMDLRMEFDMIVRWCRYNTVYYEVGFMYKNLTKDQVIFLDRFIKELLNLDKRKEILRQIDSRRR